IRDTVDFAITRHDLRALPVPEREAQARRLAAEHAATGFNLAHDLMLRVDHVAMEDDEAVLLMTMNHIAADGWSLQVLTREFTTLYNAMGQHEDAAALLPALPVQYADYAHWQREWLSGERLQAELGYWTQQLADLPPVHGLPLDRPRPAQARFEGARCEFRLDAITTAGLRRLAREHRATLFMVMHAAMSVLVARHGDSHDIVMGTPVANRLQQELESVVGFFVNMLVLRVDCQENLPFAEFLDRVKQVNLHAQAHQDIPFELLVEQLRPTRSAQYSPLFQIMLRLDAPADGTTPAAGPDGVGFEPLTPEGLSAKYELSISIEEPHDADDSTDEGLLIGLEYNVDLFDAATIDRMARRAERLLTAIVADPGTGIHDLALIDAEEQAHLVNRLNATQVDFPLHQPIQCLFEAQAARTPQAWALVCDDEHMTYGELNQRANRLASWLRRERGVRPDQLVGLCVGRSMAMIVGILGILKSGAAYVPLDPEYPADRLAFMAADASLTTVLTEQDLLAQTGFDGAHAACLDDPLLQARLALEPDDDIDPGALGLRSDHLAYVIYTSGSTGQPKGVMVEHRSLVNLTMSTQRRCGLTPSDGLLQFSTINFDPSVVDIFSALCSGSRLVLRTAHWMASVAHFWASCERHDVTILSLPTAYWHELANDPQAMPPACLRRVNIGGEQVNLALVQAWYRKPRAANIVLLNNYGPTEATVDAAVAALADGTDHIGRAIENVSLFVLQGPGRLAPYGAPGELYIGGAGLARGYLNQDALTAERFVPNPFHVPGNSASSPRLYATGDRVRYLPDGNLRFLDRLDDQVKVRGFRVELGEIESRLAGLEGVANAVVLARDDGAGDRRLVAYVARAAGTALDDAALSRAWQAALSRDLPDYMVPALYVVLDVLPLTPNGKLDKRSLPAPDPRLLQGEVVPPATGTQCRLVAFWAELLQMAPEDIGIRANFFALGGHSLLLVRLVSQIVSAFDVRLDIRKVFELPDIERLADFIDGAIELRDVQQAFEARAAAPYSELDV
ncbi:MAG: amino acid adenylation domain-containing protein, partial [Pelomonas sp.]|nr:amino acid adenylation domain-containing protein [Roseateles sp.]